MLEVVCQQAVIHTLKEKFHFLKNLVDFQGESCYTDTRQIIGIVEEQKVL